VSTRLRQFGPIVLVLVLTAVGFFVARAHGVSDARHESSHRAEIAATQVRDRVAQAAALVDGVRRLLAGPDSPGVTTEQFADVGARWLGPAGLPAAAWVERVPADARTAYEARTGHAILAPTSAAGLTLAAPHETYFPATLVTHSPPMSAPGVDVGGYPGIAAAIARPQTAYRVTATRAGRLGDGTSGLFLVQSAQRVVRGVVQPGFVVVFLPASWLLAGAALAGGSNPSVEITVGGESIGDLGSATPASSTFAAAGQRFDVGVPRLGVGGAAAAQPWEIGGAGLTLAALAGALGLIAARRARTKAELDRLFTITPDLIVVAGFDGFFKRVNPAFEALLGYSELEALTRPYLDFIHPDDRRRTIGERDAIRQGEIVPLANRYVAKDGSIRWIEWTATPVPEEQLSYAVGRDVTERRQAEADLRDAEERNRALAEEQAALRRVATLVAQRTPSEELFAAVGREVIGLFDAQAAAITRIEDDGALTVVSNSGTIMSPFAVGARLMPEPGWALTTVIETGRSARRDDYADASESVPGMIGDLGIRSMVAAPIVVEGALWGVLIIATERERFPDGTEQRLEEFTALAATAIANAESRSEVAASRARIVAAADETRRRIERDLHDGTQQRLVSLSLQLRLAESTVTEDLEKARTTIGGVASELNRVIDELREISRGIHPAILSEGGLGPALRTLARRSAIPVELGGVIDHRLPEPIEVGAYYIVSEALTNAAKHANASCVDVDAVVQDGSLRLSIRDDGVGGANPAGGSGLIGLRDRVEALGGSVEIDSPPGRGTRVSVQLPAEPSVSRPATSPRPRSRAPRVSS
jgi:PAS domain S-box-containing protein